MFAYAMNYYNFSAAVSSEWQYSLFKPVPVTDQTYRIS